MAEQTLMPQAALKYEVEVQDQGRVEFRVPFAPGAHVVVFVIQEQDQALDDLVLASQSSLDFWDNPLDDEDWNNA
jgi:hypothetical protein